MCSDKYESTEQYFSVPLKDYLEKVIELRIDSIKDAIFEARRLQEKEMAGFPGEYAKKADLLGTAIIVQEIKDKELKEIKSMTDGKLSKIEYEEKHNTLMEKIGELGTFKTVMETKASQSSVNRSLVIAIIGMIIALAAALRSFKI